MAKVVLLADGVKEEVEGLIKNFDNHGCGFGYDAQAQVLLRMLLEVVEKAQGIIDNGTGD